ncbi:hypothetical protein L208DRAFT_1273557 [Tricholoma matsutake]|nr:hypothetical protein L208DRAFT_1273557 [Tricholoma matsutake 945]
MYYRAFYNITHFLRAKNRISEAEQSRAYVRGFQTGSWTRIARRLELEFPDHYPNDPYPLNNIHDAAKFVLAGSNTLNSVIHQLTSSSHSTSNIGNTVTLSPRTITIKTKDLNAMFERFASTIATHIAGTKNPRTNLADRQAHIDALLCIFCSLSGHFIPDCMVCQSYLNEGKCKRNAEGKIVLPNRQFTPRSIPGRFIKECIDKWWKHNPDATPAATLLFSIAPSAPSTSTSSTSAAITSITESDAVSTSGSETKGIYHNLTLTADSEDRIAALERKIFTLQSVSTALVPPPSTSSSTTVNPLTSTTAPTSTSTSPALTTSPLTTIPPTQTSVHPYASVRENAYLPPHKRNFAGASKGKEKDGPSYATQAPVQNEKIAHDIFARSMKMPIVMLTSEELLSLSPKVQTKWREQVTPKQVPQSGNNATNMFSPDTIIVPDPYETYISSLRPGEIPQPFIVAKETSLIRSVIMDVHGNNQVESVVDPGSSIILMAEDVCHELSLAYDSSIRLPMQSANGTVDETLSLACNMPCDLGGITLYMQIHIIQDPAYDILLGQPFDVLTESVIRNYWNEAQTITICDPNSTRTATIPSIPQLHHRRKVVREDFQH